MNHDKIKETIPAFYDHELSPSERDEMIAHFESCSECRNTLEEWIRTAQIFLRQDVHGSSEKFVQSVMTKIDRLESEEKWVPTFADWKRWIYPAFIGAALAGFALVMTVPLQESGVTLDNLYLNNKSESVPSDWVVSNETPREGQILGYVMGEL